MLNDLIILLLSSLLFFLLTRGVVAYYVSYFLPKRKRKKLQKKPNTFVEWITYKEYIDCLPKSILIYYFSIFVTFFVSIFLTVLSHISGMPDLGMLVNRVYFFTNAIILMIIFYVLRLSEIKKWYTWLNKANQRGMYYNEINC